MFGSSVRYLEMDIPYDYGISGTLHESSVTSPLTLHIGSLLNTIQSLRQLEYLEIRCSLLQGRPVTVMSTASEAWRIQHLLSILHTVQTQPRLMQLRITIHSALVWRPGTPCHTYFMSRDRFLNDILGCNEMKDALRRFLTLHRFSFTLEENDMSGYRQKWWRSEIESRLHRDLHASISV